MKFRKVEKEDVVDGEEYLTSMKHGMISGIWDADEGVCRGYYWQDLEWYPYEFYVIESD